MNQHPPVRTLVVDDDFAVAAIHRGFVEAVPGFTVVGEVHLGADALRAVDELEPDLVLLDIYLPDISGIEFLTRLRARSAPAVDVIAITAARELGTVRAAMAGGVVDYLVKPFTLDVFTDRMNTYLTRREEFRRTAARAAGGGLDQDQVDALLRPGPAGAAAARLPKGLSERTLQLVASALAEAGRDLSAAELAERVGLSRISARRYLEHLAASGRATVAPRYGGAGRPEHRYRWSVAEAQVKPRTR
ncbi:response regulator [Jiangella asiatica]|uniref:Transcriptional regulatory protein n=1 Tax=Jiangella asiatica TaxID=2530372 RepID=A0A4R5DD82_9ACTN|nr:response regulator [Jiangella asiatica]TDE11772.1 response regulator [Jiangella asiatica]